MCPGPNRRAFATRSALVQHQRAVHGVRNEARRYVKADGVCLACQMTSGNASDAFVTYRDPPTHT
eukprot:2880978-Pyramimonas_sp.AAC.1